MKKAGSIFDINFESGRAYGPAIFLAGKWSCRGCSGFTDTRRYYLLLSCTKVDCCYENDAQVF